MFSNDSERREQVSIALSSVNYRKVYSSHLKKSHFIEDVFFYLKNEVMASPKIEITWDWVSDVYVYIKSYAVRKFEHLVRNSMGTKIWSIYNDKYFEIWTF